MAYEGHSRFLRRYLKQKILSSGIGILTAIVLISAWISRQNRKISVDVPSPSFDETAQFDIGFYV
jgi:hypothetical protein